MYRIEKHFTFAGGHRLSKHKGRCFSIHGHNYDVCVGIKSPVLDKNDMVIDFSVLKDHVNVIIDPLDHCLLVNECDLDDLIPFKEKGMRISSLPGGIDPTAERISEHIYNHLKETFTRFYNDIQIDYVMVHENDDSNATYSED